MLCGIALMACDILPPAVFFDTHLPFHFGVLAVTKERRKLLPLLVIVVGGGRKNGTRQRESSTITITSTRSSYTMISTAVIHRRMLSHPQRQSNGRVRPYTFHPFFSFDAWWVKGVFLHLVFLSFFFFFFFGGASIRWGSGRKRRREWRIRRVRRGRQGRRGNARWGWKRETHPSGTLFPLMTFPLLLLQRIPPGGKPSPCLVQHHRSQIQRTPLHTPMEWNMRKGFVHFSCLVGLYKRKHTPQRR